jgi:anti-sigma B factor antagonist
MKISVKENNKIHILEISGEIDFHSSRELRDKFQEVLDKKCSKLLVSLKKVSYIDSSGLATFVEVLQKMKRSGGELVLAGLAPAVRGVFEIAKLDSIFALSDSEEKALSTLAE